ncbi:arsenic resistance N-acetyltransferase ArsN2 [Haloarchaeobius iranensis]|uniref:Amino-acid N-acetyltransferase n=1 Tax=Haloarchaeobius iranensis TaxID=996166 RepID=A0A1H0A5Y0_9EURY|nr:arsenic resistance N-acetyltransferase ArsN2 [Haloarchaeobius iranensis]SDN28940.1 amino-acid N-acetyltransferase [Haloarchaeobius iranensis]
MNDLSLRPATEADIPQVESLLAANDLPHRDVRDGGAEFFIASTVDERDESTCVGGLERYGSNGLLRSVVVAEQYRGQGYGAALCDALEARARERGFQTLYLLTTTAAPFFRARGYERVEREAVPDAIRETTEFADLCPASAVCLMKPLRR